MSVKDLPPRPEVSDSKLTDLERKWLDAIRLRLCYDDLIALTTPASGDEVPIFDASANATRKITWTNLVGGAVTSSPLTMATARLLGRTTAATGAIEEISVTSPLSLASGALTTSMATARLIGRTTAATGVMEEITVGNGLTLSAGALTASGGGVTTIASGSFPAAATLDITGIVETYSYLVLQITGASSNTATRQPLVRVSVDNGSTFDATAGNYVKSSGSNAGTLASLFDGTAEAAAATFTSTTCIYGYQGGPSAMWLSVNDDSVAAGIPAWIGVYLGSALNIDALRVLWNGTGNFDAGTYALYGVS